MHKRGRDLVSILGFPKARKVNDKQEQVGSACTEHPAKVRYCPDVPKPKFARYCIFEELCWQLTSLVMIVLQPEHNHHAPVQKQSEPSEKRYLGAHNLCPEYKHLPSELVAHEAHVH